MRFYGENLKVLFYEVLGGNFMKGGVVNYLQKPWVGFWLNYNYLNIHNLHLCFLGGVNKGFYFLRVRKVFMMKACIVFMVKACIVFMMKACIVLMMKACIKFCR